MTQVCQPPVPAVIKVTFSAAIFFSLASPQRILPPLPRVLHPKHTLLSNNEPKLSALSIPTLALLGAIHFDSTTSRLNIYLSPPDPAIMRDSDAPHAPTDPIDAVPSPKVEGVE
ncbi:hypothetical protein HOY80DRAFT_1002091 [Tuber brumale]|nr:hypothetical protein HOY80DRAFT_1002091 [Tuber brumale]